MDCKNATRPSRGVFHQKQSEQHYQIERKPACSELAAFIEQFWWVRWELGQTEHIQNNLPDPSVNIVFSEEVGTLYGPVSQVFSYPLTGTGQRFGIKFTPAGYASITGVKMQTLVDQEVTVSEWWGVKLSALLPLAANAKSFVHLCDHLEAQAKQQDWLMTPEASCVNNAIEAIHSEQSLYQVAHLAEMLDISERTLQRRFLAFVGLSPKWIIRKSRMQEAIMRINDESIDWVDLANELGYFDQAHFIHDFKAITGTRPSEYLEGKAKLVDA